MSDTRPVTAAEMFAILGDWCRCIEQIDPLGVDTAWNLGDDVTIQRWAIRQGLVQVRILKRRNERAIRRWFENLFAVSMPNEMWTHALRDPRRRTVRELCNELAASTRLPLLRELEILGRRCLPAAVFRRFQAAAEPWNLEPFGPSTALAELDIHTLGIVTIETATLAPGVMPVEEVLYERQNFLTWLLLRSGVVLWLAASASLFFIPQFFGVFATISIASGLFHASIGSFKAFGRASGECRRNFGEYQTVGDLCRAIAHRHRAARVGIG